MSRPHSSSLTLLVVEPRPGPLAKCLSAPFLLPIQLGQAVVPGISPTAMVDPLISVWSSAAVYPLQTPVGSSSRGHVDHSDFGFLVNGMHRS